MCCYKPSIVVDDGFARLRRHSEWWCRLRSPADGRNIHNFFRISSFFCQLAGDLNNNYQHGIAASLHRPSAISGVSAMSFSSLVSKTEGPMKLNAERGRKSVLQRSQRVRVLFELIDAEYKPGAHISARGSLPWTSRAPPTNLSHYITATVPCAHDIQKCAVLAQLPLVLAMDTDGSESAVKDVQNTSVATRKIQQMYYRLFPVCYL